MSQDPIKMIHMKGNGGLKQGSSSGGGGKQSYFGYNLKIKLMGITNRLTIEYERKKDIKDDSKVNLRNWNNKNAIYWDENYERSMFWCEGQKFGFGLKFEMPKNSA